MSICYIFYGIKFEESKYLGGRNKKESFLSFLQRHYFVVIVPVIVV